MKAELLVKAIGSVTAKWEKQRKAEERRNKSQASRALVFRRMYRETVKDVAWEIMEWAYNKARGRYSVAAARQIMYAARPEILARTGEPDLDSQYFTQTLLPDYIEEHGCYDWKVAYDARGNFHEPHTKRKVPLGTVEVRRYLGELGGQTEDHGAGEFDTPDLFPTCGPTNRYQAVLFIEKEGFLPLLREAKIAERYDIGIMSTKGLSVTAARELVDNVCGHFGIPLLVLHDFDKAGFSIVGTLQRDTRRYSFVNDCDVRDLGLRLTDAKEYDLQSETVFYRGSAGKVRANLQENGATEEEVEFLCPKFHNRGSRIELNAFTCDQFVDWLEAKLRWHGVHKVVPDDDVLETAYRRALQVSIVRNRIAEIESAAAEEASAAELPADLRDQVVKRLESDRAIPWDAAVMKIASAEA
jgi:hypothetical protein